MIDLLTATQDAVFAVLKAGVPANLGTVTQHVPEDWQPPLIVVGSIEATNTGTKNDPEESHSVEIVYAYRGEARRNLYAMMFAGRSAIEGATLTIPGVVFGKPVWQSSVTDLADDGVTYQGIQTFEIIVQPDE